MKVRSVCEYNMTHMKYQHGTWPYGMHKCDVFRKVNCQNVILVTGTDIGTNFLGSWSCHFISTENTLTGHLNTEWIYTVCLADLCCILFPSCAPVHHAMWPAWKCSTESLTQLDAKCVHLISLTQHDISQGCRITVAECMQIFNQHEDQVLKPHNTELNSLCHGFCPNLKMCLHSAIFVLFISLIIIVSLYSRISEAYYRLCLLRQDWCIMWSN